jgi:hypothetical protein
MPTPRERAATVVNNWRPSQVLPTTDLERLVTMIAAAIDAQVADWMASQPRPNGWHDVAVSSPVVKAEIGKDYEQRRIDAVVAENGRQAVHEGTVAVKPDPGRDLAVQLIDQEQRMIECATCLHTTTRWDPQNRVLVCSDCKREFTKGTCIRCGQPATAEESFSCGKACA